MPIWGPLTGKSPRQHNGHLRHNLSSRHLHLWWLRYGLCSRLPHFGSLRYSLCYRLPYLGDLRHDLWYRPLLAFSPPLTEKHSTKVWSVAKHSTKVWSVRRGSQHHKESWAQSSWQRFALVSLTGLWPFTWIMEWGPPFFNLQMKIQMCLDSKLWAWSFSETKCYYVPTNNIDMA